MQGSESLLEASGRGSCVCGLEAGWKGDGEQPFHTALPKCLSHPKKVLREEEGRKDLGRWKRKCKAGTAGGWDG